MIDFTKLNQRQLKKLQKIINTSCVRISQSKIALEDLRKGILLYKIKQNK